MSYKPSDVFLDVIDVFVLLLPGAFLAAALDFFFDWRIFWPSAGRMDSEAWLTFAFGSYVGGHVISLVGSTVEDFVIRRTSYGEMVTRRHGKLRQRVKDLLSARFPGGDDMFANPHRAARVLIRLGGDAGAAHVLRKDADRRFFRNLAAATGLLLAIGLAILALGLASDDQRAFTLWLIPALGLLLWRFWDQDLKYARDVYEHALLMDTLGMLGWVGAAEAGRASHAPPTRPERSA